MNGRNIVFGGASREGYTPQDPTTDSLINANLPVEILGDRNPGEVPSVEVLVHTSKNDLSTVRSLLATEHRRKEKE